MIRSFIPETVPPRKSFMQTITPKDLFFDQLRDLHSVETQLAASLPTLLQRVSYGPLAWIIAQHADETTRQVELVTSIFRAHKLEIGSDSCQAIRGLIAGGDSHLEAVEVPQTRDLMMIAHCLRIEHYEIAAYEITLCLAQQLGLMEEASLLSAILAEERSAASKLTEIQPVLFERALAPLIL